MFWVLEGSVLKRRFRRKGSRQLSDRTTIFYIGLPCLLFFLVSCTVNNQATKCVSEEAIVYGSRSAFGGAYAAGSSFFDMANSQKPTTSLLTEPGGLEGHWISPDSKSVLTITRLEPGENAPIYFYYQDGFKIVINHDSRSTFGMYLHASYGVFTLYGMDIDSDGIDEIFIESGRGRGTGVYVKRLSVFKVGPKHFQCIFEIRLNDYIGGEPTDGRLSLEPDVWERCYSLRDIDGDGLVEIILNLIPPESIPKFIGLSEWTGALQFQRLVYSYSKKHCTYRLTDFDFTKMD